MEVVERIQEEVKNDEAVMIVDAAHERKESDMDDVFEEAMELDLENEIDEADGFKTDFEDAAGCLSDTGDIDQQICFIEGKDDMEVRDENVSSEGVTEIDERVLHRDSRVAGVIDGGDVNVVETKAVDVEEGELVDTSVVVETSMSSVVEEIGGNNGGGKNTEVVVENVDDNHVKRIMSVPEESPSVVASQGQSEKFKEIKEAIVADTNNHGDVMMDGSLDDALCDSLHVEVNHGTLGESEIKGDCVKAEVKDANCVEDSSSNIIVPADNGSFVPIFEKKEVAIGSIASDSRAQNSSNGQLQQETDNRALLEEKHTTEGKSNIRTGQNSPPNKETAVSPANPTLPAAHPAGLGRAAPLSEPASKSVHQPRANAQPSQVRAHIVEDSTNGDVEEGDEVREKLQMIRVKFLRLAYRLGQTPHNVVVAQVLYRLGLAEQIRARNGGRVGAFNFDRASAMAEQLEAAQLLPLDFSCTIMVLGKTGVGKSSTLNSIFDEVKFGTDAFQTGTKKVQDVVGTVQGIKVRVIDTPGLSSSISDRCHNERILRTVKRFISKSPPDIVLYLDRLDMPTKDFGDMPHLRTITDVFGPSIWLNAIVVLTHAASAPPDGANGVPTTYDMFVTQRSQAVQTAIRQAAGDMRLMNPVALAENHLACRTNRAGQRVLPNGQVWKPHLLLLSFASKIMAEANVLLKLQDSPPGKSYGTRSRTPPLPFLLSSLLQSRPQLKLPEEQYADNEAMDDELDESSGSDEELEYSDLPPFKPLTKAELAKLTKAQRKAYYDELEYREKLSMKIQLKEERKRRKMMKKMAGAVNDTNTDYNTENAEEFSGGAASLPVPMPDLSLPASFDSDNPTHRYRYLDTSNQWLVRPVLDNHGWDHDVGYEGINVERMFAVKDKIPLSISAQVSKDKKEANLQMEVASSIKHGVGKATTLGFDMQSGGKDTAYTLRSETKFCNFRHNKATAGLSATLLGDTLSAGLKIEDKLILNKRLRVVMSGGAMACREDIAYGGSFEATLRDKDYPLGRFLSTLGLSVMDWHGELAIGCNIQSQIPVGRFSNLVARANLNNRGSGQVSLRVNSSEQLQLALIGLLPLLRKLTQRQEDPLGY